MYNVSGNADAPGGSTNPSDIIRQAQAKRKRPAYGDPVPNLPSPGSRLTWVRVQDRPGPSHENEEMMDGAWVEKKAKEEPEEAPPPTPTLRSQRPRSASPPPVPIPGFEAAGRPEERVLKMEPPTPRPNATPRPDATPRPGATPRAGPGATPRGGDKKGRNRKVRAAQLTGE